MFLHSKNVSKEFLNNLRDSRILSKSEESVLAKKIRKGNKSAYEELIKNNQRLILSIVRKYCRREDQINDLMQEGNIGLMKAIEKFDEKKDIKFSTYATWWIRHFVVSAMSYKFSSVRLPGRKLKFLKELNQFLIEFMQKEGRFPTNSEIAENSGVSAIRVQKILKMTKGYFRIEPDGIELKDNDCFSLEELGDRISSDNSIPVEETIRRDLKERLIKVINTLSDKMKNIVLYRYGFSDGIFHTLKECGIKYGMSAEAIRLYEKKAFEIIRKRSNLLEDYLN